MRCLPPIPARSLQCIVMGFAVGTLFLQQSRNDVADAQVRQQRGGSSWADGACDWRQAPCVLVMAPVGT